ncbi:hypothetical protein MMC22_001614 [Lobaria immixta]|nr:hypothetical protein [Lobaria immixta]
MLSLNISSYAVDYTTRRPSPLSSSTFNACAPFPDQMKDPFKPTPRLSHSRNRGQAIPPLRNMDVERDRRRKDFLRKVRQAGDDQKWRSRGDQILREDYVSRRKQWEEQQAKSAPEMLMVPEDDDVEFSQESWSKVAEGMEVMDDILQHEDQELDTLISGLEESNSTTMEQKCTKTTEDYGSDDEEYVSLCMEAVSAIEAKSTAVSVGDTQEATSENFQDMDMSSG